MARKTTVAPAPGTTASQASRPTRKAAGDSSKAQPIIISDDEGSDGIELVPSSRKKSPGKTKAVAGASKATRGGGARVKIEEGVDDIVAVLGGITLNGQDGQKVKVEPVTEVSTPAKPVPKDQTRGLIDLSYVSPFPTPAPATRQPPAVSQTPLFLPEDSDPESDWAPTTKKGKAARRVIRDPDSDSDVDIPASEPSAPSPIHSAPQSPISVTSSPAVSPPPPILPRSQAGPSTKPKVSVKRFFDLEARGGRSRYDSESEEDEHEREEKEKKWRMKYYDESLGSLKDFIVDDDYVSEEDEEDESEAESEEESSEDDRRRRTRRPEGSKKATKEIIKVKEERIPPRTATKPISTKVIEILDSDSDDSVVHSDPDTVDDLSEDDSQDADALLHFSPPPRLHTLPDLATLTLHSVDSDSEPEIPPTPARTSSARRIVPPTPKTPSSKKKWGLDRTRIAQQIFDELDRKVFDSKLGAKGAGTKLEWNNRLLTTAGQAHSKRMKKSDGTKMEEVKIILSEKVLTGEAQILSTVAHEMCHVASWVISEERKNPHGKVFQTWGRKVMRFRPDIEVTTKHDYQIEYKFQWRCIGASCDKIYKRHSKSIDIEKQACGRCRGKLEPMFETKKETAFQVYLRQNLSTAKSAMPGSSHGDVMRALSRQWTEAGPQADHQAHWAAMASAVRS